VQSIDKFGNEIPTGGADVAAYIKGPDSSDEPETVQVDIVDNQTWIYNATYEVHHVGRYQLHVSIGGVAIASSPFAVRTTSGTPVATKSLVKDLSGLPPGVAKSDTPAFKVHLHDKNGNKKTKGGEKELQVYLRKPIRKPARIIDNGDGTYEVIYPKGLEVGEYEVVAELRGEKIEIPNTSVQVEEPGGLPEEEQTLLDELLPSSASTLTNYLRGLDEEKKASFISDLKALYAKK